MRSSQKCCSRCPTALLAGRSFNPANQLITSTNGISTTTYTYDDTGNLVQFQLAGTYEWTEYHFNQRHLLITQTHNVLGTGDVVDAVFVYDGDGGRVQQVDYTGATPITTTYTNDIIGLTNVLVADNGTT